MKIEQVETVLCQGFVTFLKMPPQPNHYRGVTRPRSKYVLTNREKREKSVILVGNFNTGSLGYQQNKQAKDVTDLRKNSKITYWTNSTQPTPPVEHMFSSHVFHWKISQKSIPDI